MIRVLGLVKSRIKEDLGVDPQREGVQWFRLYGGIELSFLEYSLLKPGKKLLLAFEGEEAVWLIVHLVDGRSFSSEVDTSSSADELLMLVRAAIAGEIRVHRSFLGVGGGIRIKGAGVSWYLDPDFA